nr:MAG TPA: hypothetical protein [Caudoviricetes sp.]
MISDSFIYHNYFILLYYIIIFSLVHTRHFHAFFIFL